MQVSYVTLDPNDTDTQLLFSGCVLVERSMCIGLPLHKT